MQKITTNHRWNYLHFWNPPGTYILENQAASTCLAQSPGAIVETVSRENWQKKSLLQLNDGDRILIVRPGAFGDLLMMTPLIRSLRAQYPLSEVHVACAEAYMSVLQGVVGLTPYPTTEDALKQYDLILWMEDVLENNPVAEGLLDGVDCFFERAGMAAVDGKHLDYEIKGSEESEAMERAGRTRGKKRVTIQCRSSSQARNYSTENWTKIIHGLWERKVEVFLVGAPHEISGFTEDQAIADIYNMTDIPLSFRQSAAIVATSDLLLSVDSAMMHVAGALGVPCISLHGPVSAESRTSSLKNNTPLTGDCSNCDLAPCYYHQKGSQLFPEEAPCVEAGECVVVNSIPPSIVLEEACKQLQIKY
tara:strand:- start:9738 stop:10826 length:1089 start_codon:yes stop_codon:yes gene_type:complete